MINNRRDILIQTIVVAAIAVILFYFYTNAVKHLLENNISSGFSFLHEATGFDIIMHLIPYSPTSTNLDAFFVGILNTLLLTVLAIGLSSIVALIVAAAKLSDNWIITRLGETYIETFRNVPLLLQVFLWYYLQMHYLPQADHSLIFFDVVQLNVRGLFFMDYCMIPEMISMLLGLSLYFASFLAEAICSGIRSINKGQLEAAAALSFDYFLTLKLIVLPQTKRKIVQPVVNIYLRILKSSSLGSAIGYPDLVAVFAGSVLNQTGQAIETILMTLSFYLIINSIVLYIVQRYTFKEVPK
jgi:general L-amino acid transport system permease protein